MVTPRNFARACGAVLLATSAIAQTKTTPRLGPPAAWERVVRGAYENKGIAQIERLGNRWLLNVMCGEVHAAYIDDTTLDLSRFTNRYVSVRYKYVDRTVDVQCVRAPCPPMTERRVSLERVTPRTVSARKALDISKSCGASK
jgi:hypothetical protein